MALMFAICSAQPNWMPKKPKLMFQICQKLRCGFCAEPALDVDGPKPPTRHLPGGAASLLDEEDLAAKRFEVEGHALAVDLSCGLRSVQEIGDRSAPGRRGDRDGLLHRFA